MPILRGGARSTSNVALNSAVSSETEESTESAPIEYFRSDYKALPNIVSKINMSFDIRDGKTTVTSEITGRTESKPIQGSSA